MKLRTHSPRTEQDLGWHVPSTFHPGVVTDSVFGKHLRASCAFDQTFLPEILDAQPPGRLRGEGLLLHSPRFFCHSFCTKISPGNGNDLSWPNYREVYK